MELNGENWQLDELSTLRVMLKLYVRMGAEDRGSFITRAEFVGIVNRCLDCVDRTVDNSLKLIDCVDSLSTTVRQLSQEVLLLKSRLEDEEP